MAVCGRLTRHARSAWISPNRAPKRQPRSSRPIRGIFSDPRGRPLSKAQLISRQHAEAIKPAEIGQPTEIAKPAESAKPAEPVKLVETAHPTEAVNSAETSRPTEATKPVETTSRAEAIKPMEASRPLEVAEPVEMARPVEADLPSATIHAKAEETKWLVSATTSPVDYTAGQRESSGRGNR